MRSPMRFVSRMAVLAVAAAAMTASPAWAGSNHNTESGATITLHVYDYVQANRATLIAAEGETSRILAAAGVKARWTDCPISHSAMRNEPNCPASTSSFDDYIVSIEPDVMARKLPRSSDAFGTTLDAPSGPYRAYIFYERITADAGGNTGSTGVLVGRVMAHEIGHMVLGSAHSRTGIMRAHWSLDDFTTLAGPQMLFTPAQSRQFSLRLVQTYGRQAESGIQVAGKGGAGNDKR
jgi:hypothetical protein